MTTTEPKHQEEQQEQQRTEQQTQGERWRSWRALLEDAIRTPGLLHQAYRQFPGYSMRNQLLAMAQCEEREILPGPLGTFVFWQRLGRNVIKGERALTLCVPITIKRMTNPASADANRTDADAADERPEILRGFSYRRGWFTLHQTSGPDIVLPVIPAWDATRAIAVLGVSVVPFASLNGNSQGYAEPGAISINPVAALPHKTLFHELAHLALDHHNRPDLPSAVREVEAESVALLSLDALDLPGAVYSRGYLQHWLTGHELTDVMAQRIFTSADKILAAGRPPDT
jgi:hypothetical protein